MKEFRSLGKYILRQNDETFYFSFVKDCREERRLKNNTIIFVTGLYILYVLWAKLAAVLAEFHFGSVQYMPNRNSTCLSQAFAVLLVILFRNSFALRQWAVISYFYHTT
jgi:hypothetical protein